MIGLGDGGNASDTGALLGRLEPFVLTRELARCRVEGRARVLVRNPADGRPGRKSAPASDVTGALLDRQ